MRKKKVRWKVKWVLKELRDKIVAAMQEEFVGNYIFSDEDLSIIYDEAGYVLKRIDRERGIDLSYYDYDLIFVALVNLAKEWNSGENAFFDYIYRRLLGSMYCGGKIYTQITNVIKSLYDSKRIFMLNSYTKKYYATLCSHSFAPLNSIESFFDMCWEIYCKDLDQQYGEKDPAFKLITDSLAKKFSSSSSDEDDFKIGSEVYSFRAGIRGLAIDKPNLMTGLLDETMRSINSLFNNEPIKTDKYISKLIHSWWKKKESRFGVKKVRNRRNGNICTEYFQIRPKYILEDGIAKLFIPSIRLSDNFSYNPYIEIKVNGEKIKCERMKTSGSGILMATDDVEINLSDLGLFDCIDIHIEITHCDNVIYDSKENLKRDFILFNDSREVLSQDCLPGIYFLYTPNIGTLLQYPENIQKILDNTYSLKSFEGDVVQSKGKTVFFLTEKSDRAFIFYAKEHNDVIYRLGDKEYKVIDGELHVDVSETIDINNIGVRYEETSFKLSDFDHTIINGKRRYIISNLLNVGEPQRISIFRYSDNNILASISLIKFNNIKIIFDKPLYYGKDITGVVRFITEKYNIEEQFNIESKEVTLPVEGGEIILYPPVLRWRIDEGEWHTKELSSGLWYKKITNSSILHVNLPKTMSCIFSIKYVNGTLEQSENGFDFKLGQTIHSLTDIANIAKIAKLIKFFSVYLMVDKTKEFLITNIYVKETFTDDPLFVMSKMNKVFWLPETYFGNTDDRFRLDVLDENQKTIFSKILTTEKESFDFGGVNEGRYSYKITLLRRKIFIIENERKLFEGSFVLGDEKSIKYKNKAIIIKKVILFDKLEPEQIKPVYLDNIKYLGKKENYDYYSGNLFIVDRRGHKIYLNNMRDEFNNHVKINPVRIEIKSATSCYLGYGLDPYDEDYEFDNEFTLDRYGRTTIVQKSFGNNTRGIDYFLFEVIKNV